MKRKKQTWALKFMDGPCAQYSATIETERPPALYSIPWVWLTIFGCSYRCAVTYEACPPTGPDFIPYRLKDIRWPTELGKCPMCGRKELRKGKGGK